MEDHISSNVSIYLLLIISLILVTIDVLELNNLLYTWKKESQIKTIIFEECIKFDLLSKTCFSIFSFFSAISASFLTFFLIFNTDVFLDKFLSTFLYFNYMVFGPIMFAFSILGLAHWNDVMYVCSKGNFHNKLLSYSNIISVFGALLISCAITILISIYKTINLYVDSTQRKPEGSDLLRKLFWFVLLKNRSASDLVRLGRESN